MWSGAPVRQASKQAGSTAGWLAGWRDPASLPPGPGTPTPPPSDAAPNPCSPSPPPPPTTTTRQAGAEAQCTPVSQSVDHHSQRFARSPTASLPAFLFALTVPWAADCEEYAGRTPCLMQGSSLPYAGCLTGLCKPSVDKVCEAPRASDRRSPCGPRAGSPAPAPPGVVPELAIGQKARGQPPFSRQMQLPSNRSHEHKPVGQDQRLSLPPKWLKACLRGDSVSRHVVHHQPRSSPPHLAKGRRTSQCAQGGRWALRHDLECLRDIISDVRLDRREAAARRKSPSITLPALPFRPAQVKRRTVTYRLHCSSSDRWRVSALKQVLRGTGR